MKDYYQILGVEKGASEDDIKRAFRTLAHKYHPDKKGGDEAKFKEVSEAYAVLSDKKRRAEYDTYGRTFSGAGQASGFGGFDFSNADFSGANFQEFDLGDIFGEFFVGMSGRGRTRRGRDISIDIELTFKEAIFGAERRVLISKVGECDICKGSGAKKGTAMRTCESCNGKGAVRETRNSFFGTFTSMRTCPRCKGRGEIPETPCEACAGEGVLRRQEEIVIAVPAGVSDGEMIRMPGRGEAAPGAVAGDLYVKLHVKDDAHFSREGSDLVTTLPIKLTDALLGGEYRIDTLDGEMTITVPAGVEHGEFIRVRGKGVPNGRGSRGDLLVRVHIEFPKKLSKEAKKLIEQLRIAGL
ncbi:molecular chaperone DnaJ [Candidatus Kaiserbacteria bacterium CG10_big_fil_rev_8_21_14_0_10_59_10]|uniref:Chaperone protein DnaJ n=1 Tax=Candidatus Kaiserbacteria bacterium CG10_big_fil_rev_8_21_14_0_10_59_10 TaxID=1974612 RepID=A0A2H0U7D9_9BACT|nr:MAG: molecular chaperone DnaJ [Candidatus Kaiserbacteria bacterium CG10_big_fil_rev_8_21_14_0_10_59_10]